MALAMLAVPALAARVVDVRVGQHPTFTRIVFELDQMRGYRLERDGDADVLVVSLDASATPESIAARGMIDRVVVEQAVGGAVARIYLKGTAANPRVQEMILGKPPRIVLDVIKSESVAAVTAPKPTRAPEPSLPVVPEPKPEPVQVASKPAPAPVEPALEPSLPVVPEPEPMLEPVVPEPVEIAPAVEPDVALAEPPPVPDAMDGEPMDGEAVDGEVEAPTQDPVEIAKPVVPAPKPMPAPAKPAPPASNESGSGGLLQDPMVMGGGVLVVFLALVGFMVMRRKKKAAAWSPEDEDASIFGDSDEESIAAAGEDAVAGEVSDEESNTRIPAGGFSMDDLGEGAASPAAASQDTPFGDSGSTIGDDVISAPRPSNVVSIFDADADDASASQGDEPMSDMMSDLPADPSGVPAAAPPPPVVGGNAGGDVARMMEAMERRMNDLEARLGEAEEAREKLERQVAAQAEELRVQRAAIARTQRALRGMSRAGDDKPSEPALRDDTQARTRVTGA
jgi:uncharacterized coiled-coil protein SlyX